MKPAETATTAASRVWNSPRAEEMNANEQKIAMPPQTGVGETFKRLVEARASHCMRDASRRIAEVRPTESPKESRNIVMAENANEFIYGNSLRDAARRLGK